MTRGGRCVGSLDFYATARHRRDILRGDGVYRSARRRIAASTALVPAQVFGANAMTSEERRRRQFDGVADVDAAARVWTAASELRERLAALAEAAEAPAKPATSAGDPFAWPRNPDALRRPETNYFVHHLQSLKYLGRPV